MMRPRHLMTCCQKVKMLLKNIQKHSHVKNIQKLMIVFNKYIYGLSESILK